MRGLAPAQLAPAVLALAASGAAACDRPITPGPPDRPTIVGPAAPPTVAGPATGKPAAGPARPKPTPVAGHPRIWLRAEDLPRLRSWAVEANPIWRDGLANLAAQAVKDMDAGKVPSADQCVNGIVFCETYAELFAFLYLVHPDEKARADYGQRARKILMHTLDRAATGKEGEPFAKESFALGDRSRWAGEAFPVTVDWIYPLLTPADKKTIRKVFLRWAEQQLDASTTSHNHPKPKGLLNDPALVQERAPRRYAANNYFTAHMRNLTLMSLALDPGDDPADATGTYKTLRGYLANATGAWLYMTDHVLRNDGRGGSAPEGFEYGPSTLAYTAQTLLALETAGEADPEKYGPQVVAADNPFFTASIAAYLHGLSPGRKTSERGGTLPEVAYTGDGERYILMDFVGYFAPLALLARATGDVSRVAELEFVQTELAPGGTKELPQRSRAWNGGAPLKESILYFLLMDPKLPPKDPRPATPLEHWAEGTQRMFARTGWDADASWFTWQLGWQTIDHQHGDGNSFSLYRKGEWLTKERVGYGYHFANSDNHNTLTVENEKNRSSDQLRSNLYKRGSQWILMHNDDGKVVAKSLAKDYAYALGDATGLYNSDYENTNDVKHVSRSILWIKPDHVAVYDRAETGKDGRFKRQFFHTESAAVVTGKLATATTKGGQKLFVTSLLPDAASVEAFTAPPGTDWDTKPARDEPMMATIKIEATPPARDARFLTVLQGADGSAKADPTAVLKTSGATPYAGAALGAYAVLFPVVVGPVAEVAYEVPATVKKHFVTGLEPGHGYDVVVAGGKVTVKPGSQRKADEGGVLVF